METCPDHQGGTLQNRRVPDAGGDRQDEGLMPNGRPLGRLPGRCLDELLHGLERSKSAGASTDTWTATQQE
jgi:hypothetical protein